MKTVIAATLLASSVVTGVYQDTFRQEQQRQLKERVEAAGKLWGAREEAAYWKRMAEGMVRDVECIPLVGGKENRRYNRPEDPGSVVNDPGRFWYS